MALRRKLSLFPLQTRNRMEMLAEASLWSPRKEKRSRWQAERKEGRGRGQNEKDEEAGGKQKGSRPAELKSLLCCRPLSQAATGRQAKNILSLKVLTAPGVPPPPSRSLMSLLHSFLACSVPALWIPAFSVKISLISPPPPSSPCILSQLTQVAVERVRAHAFLCPRGKQWKETQRWIIHSTACTHTQTQVEKFVQGRKEKKAEGPWAGQIWRGECKHGGGRWSVCRRGMGTCWTNCNLQLEPESNTHHSKNWDRRQDKGEEKKKRRMGDGVGGEGISRTTCGWKQHSCDWLRC